MSLQFNENLGVHGKSLCTTGVTSALYFEDTDRKKWVELEGK